jgi:hypothetical protein
VAFVIGMRVKLTGAGGSVMLHDLAYGGTQGTELFTNVSLEMLPSVVTNLTCL